MKSVQYMLLAALSFQSASLWADQVLHIHGSHTVGGTLAPAIIESWLKSKGYAIAINSHKTSEERTISAVKAGEPPITIELATHGSSTAFKDLATGKAHIGLSSRPIHPDEITKLSALGKMDALDAEYVVTLDGLAIIVPPTNPIQAITKDALRRIFTGEIRKWSTIGIKNSVDQISLYSRHSESGTYDTFKSLVLEDKYPLAPSAQRFETNDQLAEACAKDPAAIGFVGLAYAGKNKILAVAEGHAKPVVPTAFEIGTEDYPLSRRLYIYVPEKNPHPLAREFAQYAISAESQRIAAKLGFIAQDLLDNSAAIPTIAPDEYKQFTQRAKRLSMNVRFDQSEVKPDNKAIRDIDRLIHYLSLPANQGRKVMLFGFADSHETSPFASLMLSTERADAVADYLIRHGVAPLRVRGYGQDLPIADDTSNRGRYRNRRVEVWVQ